MLARRQSDVLAHKLGNPETMKELPLRALPYGSEGVKSPTYLAPGPPASGGSFVNATKIEQPSFRGPGITMDKSHNLQTQANSLPPSEEEQDALS